MKRFLVLCGIGVLTLAFTAPPAEACRDWSGKGDRSGDKDASAMMERLRNGDGFQGLRERMAHRGAGDWGARRGDWGARDLGARDRGARDWGARGSFRGRTFGGGGGGGSGDSGGDWLAPQGQLDSADE